MASEPKQLLSLVGSGHRALDGLRACLSPRSFWVPEWLSAQSAWLEHAPFAFWLVEALRPRVLVELGTQGAFSYFAFCEAVQRLELGTRCYAVDTWKGDEHAGFYGEEVFAEVKKHNDLRYAAFSTLVRSTFDAAVHHFSDGTIDLLHIDGRHFYGDIKHDFESWQPKLSDRAVVLLHDINVREREFGVFRLWEELCSSYPHFAFLHGYGLGVLGVGAELTPEIRGLFAAAADTEESSYLREAYSRLGSVVTLTLRSDELDAAARKQAGELERLRAELDSAVQRHENSSNALRMARTTIETLEEQLSKSRQDRIRAASDAEELLRAMQTKAEDLARERDAKEQLQQQLNRANALGESQAQALEEQNAQFSLLVLKQRVLRELAAGARTAMPLGLAFTHGQLRPTFRSPGVPRRKRRSEWRAVAQSGLFDAEWYLAHNPDVANAGAPAFEHFMTYGIAECRDPHPLFSSGWYSIQMQRHPSRLDLPPLLHYLSIGRAKQLSPHPLFDPRYYLACYKDVADSGVDPLQHFLMHGAAEWRNPHPLVSMQRLAEQPELPAGSRNVLVEYLTEPQSFAASPHPLFDGRDYLAKNPDVARAGVNPLLHYCTVGGRQGRAPHRVFAGDWYLARNPDVLAADVNPLEHYVRHGAYEYRDPHPLFDIKFYYARYPEARQLSYDALSDYVMNGLGNQPRETTSRISTAAIRSLVPPDVFERVGPISAFLDFDFTVTVTASSPGDFKTQPTATWPPKLSPTYWLPQTPAATLRPPQTGRIRDLEVQPGGISGERDRLADDLAKATTEVSRAEKSSCEQPIDAEAAHAGARNTDRNCGAWRRFLSTSQRRSERRLLESGLFDAQWYLREYPDAATTGRSPAGHYLAEGYLRGYRPNPLFDTRWYLEHYEDARRASVNPALHYLMYGSAEGRDPGPNFHTRFYLEANPDVRSNGMNPLAHYLRHGRHEGRPATFSKDFYLAEYPDVTVTLADPYLNYLQTGKSEGRVPAFDAEWYLAEYPDVAAAGVDPYRHYLLYGKAEGRRAAFSREAYLAANPDVVAAAIDPYQHYLKHGRQEHRPLTPRPAPSKRVIPYDSEYEAQENYSQFKTDIKALAFYLPQFHECEQNNEWWGQGYTEWSATKRSKPRFSGHYQPREPHDDFGYYDLSDVATLRSQAALARRHGIHGFCFYHYWFSGKRILEKPVDILLEHPDIDINFCLCWANENWTRTWDGLQDDILVEQKYHESDPLHFMLDVTPYLLDGRYLRIDNKPIIIVYKAHLLPDAGEVFSAWRRYWRDTTGGELLIWCCRTNFEDTALKKLQASIDAVVEFPPHVLSYEIDPKRLDLTISGHLYDYRTLVSEMISGSGRTETPSIDFYRSVMLGWDNSARRQDGYSIWYGFSLDCYYRWLRYVVAYARRVFAPDRRFVFINAWNEWGEGTYLEPDKHCGYANINTTSRALFDLPRQPMPRVPATLEEQNCPGKIAVHCHIYFEDLADELLTYICNVPFPFDLYVTTDTKHKCERIKTLWSKISEREGTRTQLTVLRTPNVGRDIAPFLVELSSKLLDYDFIGHFHTKKSSTVDWGEGWRRYLLDNLLGSSDSIRGIFHLFVSDELLGLVYPPPYVLIAPHADWGGTKERCSNMLRKMDCDIWLPENPRFPAGNMFWARSAAIAPILAHIWSYDQFEPEIGQVEHTLAHSIERLWRFVASHRGYQTAEVLLKRPSSDKTMESCARRRLTIFAHYDERNVISDSDLFYVKSIKETVGEVIFVSNAELSFEQKNRVSPFVVSVMQRDNVGFDFGAWRDCLEMLGWERLKSYDELILANNSCYGPVFPFSEMFYTMDGKQCDFWSVTGFPSLRNPSREEARLLPNGEIPLHLQSYFIVFRQPILASNAFRSFWAYVADKPDIAEVVALYETQLTKVLSNAGFKWDCYLKESFIMQERNGHIPEFNATYCMPVELLTIHTPLIKKKASIYAPEEIEKLRDLVRAFGYYPPDLLFCE